MNLLGASFRILVIAAMVFASNTRSIELRNCAKPVFIGAGSVLINEKKAAELFGEEYISARKQVIIGKAFVGALANTSGNSLGTYRFSADRQHLDEFFIPVVSNSAIAGYAVVNSALHLGGDYFDFDEKYIDKKCDEYLSEDIALYAKPVANYMVDLAYDYVTVKLVKGFMGGINKSE